MPFGSVPTCTSFVTRLLRLCHAFESRLPALLPDILVVCAVLHHRASKLIPVLYLCGVSREGCEVALLLSSLVTGQPLACGLVQHNERGQTTETTLCITRLYQEGSRSQKPVNDRLSVLVTIFYTQQPLPTAWLQELAAAPLSSLSSNHTAHSTMQLSQTTQCRSCRPAVRCSAFKGMQIKLIDAKIYKAKVVCKGVI